MRRITTIMFDLSEVLISGLFGLEKELSGLVGQSEESLLAPFGGENLVSLCRGEMSEDDYLAQILECEGWSTSIEDLKVVIRGNFHRQMEGMVSLVEGLSSRYTVVLVSDHAREWVEYIEGAHPFMRVFDRKVYSFYTGKTKSDPSCFPDLLSLLERKGGECVFVDDMASNVENARLAGIHGIVFQGREALEAEFSSLGIMVTHGS